MKHKDNCIYVAARDQKIVGWVHAFCTMRVESGFFAEIGGLVVHENFRKNGIGKKLVEKVFDWSKTENCETAPGALQCNQKVKT